MEGVASIASVLLLSFVLPLDFRRLIIRSLRPLVVPCPLLCESVLKSLLDARYFVFEVTKESFFVIFLQI